MMSALLRPACRRKWAICLVSALVLAASHSAVRAEEKLPAGARVVKIEAQPAQIDLRHRYDYAQLILTSQLATGEQVDVTRLARVERPEALIQMSPTGLIRPVADGAGALQVSLDGQMLSIPVKVTGQKEKYPVSFVRDVMPTLARMGCNAGTCHGSAEGKNGFKLSLRGYDPLLDHRSLTDDLEGRRFNRAAPESSLMLLKTSSGVPHVGGVLTQPGEPYYDL